jgi:hypothetical protein
MGMAFGCELALSDCSESKGAASNIFLYKCSFRAQRGIFV